MAFALTSFYSSPAMDVNAAFLSAWTGLSSRCLLWGESYRGLTLEDDLSLEKSSNRFLVAIPFAGGTLGRPSWSAAATDIGFPDILQSQSLAATTIKIITYRFYTGTYTVNIVCALYIVSYREYYFITVPGPLLKQKRISPLSPKKKCIKHD
jgi:hypothetical protein